MTPEMIVALWSGVGGVVLGSIITVVASYFQQRWLNKRRDKERRDVLKYELARDLMRNRMDQRKLLDGLNEIPLLFGDDDVALRLYREVLNPTSADQKTNSLADLIQHVATSAGLGAKVTPSDVRRGFVYNEALPPA